MKLMSVHYHHQGGRSPKLTLSLRLLGNQRRFIFGRGKFLTSHFMSTDAFKKSKMREAFL